jgi:hypothetical protein
MKKIFNLLLMSVILAMTGCFTQTNSANEPPSEEELIAAVNDLVCGEQIEYLGNGRFSSLERDLEFYESWVESYTSGGSFDHAHRYTVTLNSDSSHGSRNNYRTSVVRYWDDEINECMNRHDFDSAERSESEYSNTISQVGVRITFSCDASPEAIEEIDSFLLELRDICVMEDEFHTEPYLFRCCVDLVEFDPEEECHIGVGTFDIDALSSDEDVTLEANANPEPAWQVSRSGITEGTYLPGYIEILVN